MKAILYKKPKGVTIVQGFPGMGLVSNITTKFLIDHMDFEQIGHIESGRIPPLTAIHKGRILHPITVFYNDKKKLVLVQSIAEVVNMEWALAETLTKLAKDLQAKEIIMIEGMPSQQKGTKVYTYSTKKPKNKKFAELNEGVIMGLTAALLLKSDPKIPITCFFAEAHQNLPDSHAAAQVVNALNAHLGLTVNYKPLLKAAQAFEEKVKAYTAKMQALQQLQGNNEEEMPLEPMKIAQAPKKAKNKREKLEEDEEMDYIG